jgi:hypothetical protein
MVLAWASLAIGCGDHASDAGPVNGANEASAPVPPTARCRVHASTATGIGAFVAVASGPSGPRLFGRVGFWDAAHVGAAALDANASVAWTGTQYLVASARALTSWDVAMQHRRVVRTLPNGSCNPTLVEMPSGTALVYRRLARASEGCDRGVGSLMFETLDANGASTSAPVSLSTSPRDDSVSAFRARYDAGRLVLHTLRDEDAERFDVLSADGNRLASGTGDSVVCPRSGCIEMVLPGTGSDRGSEEPPRLRGRLVGQGLTFDTLVPAEIVSATAVRGDRVLVVTPWSEAGFSTAVWIWDVGRRSLLTIADPDGSTIDTHWLLARMPSDVRLLAQPTGFAVVIAASAADPMLYAIDCDS